MAVSPILETKFTSINIVSQDERYYGNKVIGHLTGSRFNMKKSAFTLTAMSLLGSTSGVLAQNNLTIYGLVNPEINYVSNIAGGRRIALDSGNLQGSRFGFKGTESLGGGLSASFVLETGFGVDTGGIAQGGVAFGRQAWIGLGGDFGRVSLGRQYDYAYSDLNPLNSIVWIGNAAFGAHGNNLDRAVGGRVNNSLKWQSPSFGGFSGSVIYGFGEQAGSTANGRSLGLGGKYNNGAFNVGASYFESNASRSAGAPIAVASSDVAVCPMGKGEAGDKCIQTFMIASSYKLGQATFYGAYSKVKLPLSVVAGTRSFGSTSNSSNQILDVGFTYDIGKLKLITSVIQSKAEFEGSQTSGRVSQFTLGANYYLSKRTDLYTFVTHQRAKNMLTPGVFGQATGSDRSQSAVQAGVRHTF